MSKFTPHEKATLQTVSRIASFMVLKYVVIHIVTRSVRKRIRTMQALPERTSVL
jgi:hypothetical protein